MDGDNMNKITQSAQDIKRFSAADITQNEATRIRRVFGISFNDLAIVKRFFNFAQRNGPAVTASLRMPGNLKFTSIKFFPHLLKHYNIKYNTSILLCQENGFVSID